MFKVLTITATALTGLALSSGAVAGAPKETPAAAPTSASTDASAQVQRKEKQYCIVDSATGSRIPLKVCKTRKDWMAEGFDPLNP